MGRHHQEATILHAAAVLEQALLERAVPAPLPPIHGNPIHDHDKASSHKLLPATHKNWLMKKSDYPAPAGHVSE